LRTPQLGRRVFSSTVHPRQREALDTPLPTIGDLVHYWITPYDTEFSGHFDEEQGYGIILYEDDDYHGPFGDSIAEAVRKYRKNAQGSPIEFRNRDEQVERYYHLSRMSRAQDISDDEMVYRIVKKNILGPLDDLTTWPALDTASVNEAIAVEYKRRAAGKSMVKYASVHQAQHEAVKPPPPSVGDLVVWPATVHPVYAVIVHIEDTDAGKMAWGFWRSSPEQALAVYNNYFAESGGPLVHEECLKDEAEDTYSFIGLNRLERVTYFKDTETFSSVHEAQRSAVWLPIDPDYNPIKLCANCDNVFDRRKQVGMVCRGCGLALCDDCFQTKASLDMIVCDNCGNYYCLIKCSNAVKECGKCGRWVCVNCEPHECAPLAYSAAGAQKPGKRIVPDIGVPAEVSYFKVRWVGGKEYEEEAGVRGTRVFHNVRGGPVYKETYPTKHEALCDLNCLWNEFWLPVLDGEARVLEARSCPFGDSDTSPRLKSWKKRLLEEKYSASVHSKQRRALGVHAKPRMLVRFTDKDGTYYGLVVKVKPSTRPGKAMVFAWWRKTIEEAREAYRSGMARAAEGDAKEMERVIELGWGWGFSYESELDPTFLGAAAYSAAIHERQREAAKIDIDEFGRILGSRLDELVEPAREVYEKSKGTDEESRRYGVWLGLEDAANGFDQCVRSAGRPGKLYNDYREWLDSNVDETLDFRCEAKPDEEYPPEYWNGKLVAFLWALQVAQAVWTQLKGDPIKCASCDYPMALGNRGLARCYSCDSPVHTIALDCDYVHECSYCGRPLCREHAWSCTRCNKYVCFDHQDMDGVCETCREKEYGGVP